MKSWLLFLAVIASSLQLQVNSYYIVCYFESWAIYRPGNGNFKVTNINPDLCTHHIYAFAGPNSKGEVAIDDEYADIEEGGYKQFNNMRIQHPNIKTMIALGGGSAGPTTFSKVVGDSGLRTTFVNNIVKFIEQYGFQGADIDWEFPESSSDKSAFTKFLKELRAQFDVKGFVLSAAVSGDVGTIDQAYDVPSLSKHLDFINVMAYDMHGYWESKTGENSPLYVGCTDTSDYEKTQNVDYIIKYYINKGAAPGKLILGMGTYGNSFTLEGSSNNGVGAPSIGPGKAGPYGGEGSLAYNEICEQHLAGKWTYHWNSEQKCIYAVGGDQWVGFDNIAAIKIKSKYIINNGLGGAMIWSIDMDDFRNTCGDGNYPLLNTINSYLN